MSVRRCTFGVTSAIAAEMMADVVKMQWRSAAVSLVTSLWDRVLDAPTDVTAAQMTFALRCLVHTKTPARPASLITAAARLQEIATGPLQSDAGGLSGTMAREALFSLSDLGWDGEAGAVSALDPSGLH
ncbi:hypothetical protein T484DRAFT_1922654 [Baffinella frigidus]|nr:hypothetical protein T484DRAFT_1922654 [Cryptophyta sp. CCMP2293]